MPRFDASLTKSGSGAWSNDDHGAGGLPDDLLDQAERVVGALAQSDERDVGSFSRRDRSDVLDLDLARDHLMAKGGDDRRNQRQAILPFVRDQNAQMFGLAIAHVTPQ